MTTTVPTAKELVDRAIALRPRLVAEQAAVEERTYYSQEFVVERIYREAPLLLIGEGSNEIQQLIIARRLLERYAKESR